MVNRNPPAPRKTTTRKTATRKAAARKTATTRKASSRKPTTLRAVGKDEVVPANATEKARPLTLDEAIEGGIYIEILLAQRRQIAKDIPNEKGPAKAALHRQLALISKEIQELKAAAEEEAAENGNGGPTPDEEFDPDEFSTTG
ncbi:hypothetical protein KVF89_22430 [Nocardioides carbamazepini]|uniref:hypothetical protein n=1 Tax=Nocardioides carbamazepini TaxID=2854259 RepID=UPI00214A11B4|nr:hypothetical protein [Nocardioides carbamazepini]MCR1785314.1 hypothetical protein [Nocardioides carbamazepini]